MSKEEFSAVMEVGMFGEMDMDDPTVKKIKKKSMDEIIEESIENNRKNLES